MALSGLNLNMGVLESAINADLFDTPFIVASTWDPSYYTLSGSTVTDLANPAGNDFQTIGLTNVDVVTDGDGTKWFEDNGGMTGPETARIAAADEATIGASLNGLITVESYRATSDDTSANSCLGNCGFDMLLGSPSKTFWRNISDKSAFSIPFRADMEIYRLVVAGILAAPEDGTGHYVGPLRGQGLGTGGGLSGNYDPDGNTINAAAYSTGDDIVISWFLQASGIRLMINGQFVTLYSAQDRNADGTASDAAGEAALLAQDWRPRVLNENAGNTIGDPVNQFRLYWGNTAAKVDYYSILEGDVDDSFIQGMHTLLLNNKPV